MHRLWTPWRLAYVTEASVVSPGCIFCAALPGLEREPLVVHIGSRAFVLLNKFPYNSGHLMVAPFRHTAEWESLDADELAEIGAWSQRCVRALLTTLRPEGFNIGVNQGVVAGAGIADHVHQHVVPRWGGDTNFMTTVGETKVLPESLDETYRRLKPHL